MSLITIRLGRIGRNPSRDWGYALACFAVMILVILAVDAMLYGKLLSVESTGGAQSSGEKPLNKDEISAVVKQIKQADADASAIPESILRDPSI